MSTIDTLFENRNTTIARDLKLNLKRLLEDSALTAEESSLALLSLSEGLKDPKLQALAMNRVSTLTEALSQDILVEAREAAAIMGMLNTYYRFRHFLREEAPTAAENYKEAKLRMTSLAKPGLGKTRFEMLAFALSVLNGCASCVASHEEALQKEGVPAEKIHDLARLASVAKATHHLLQIN